MIARTQTPPSTVRLKRDLLERRVDSLTIAKYISLSDGGIDTELFDRAIDDYVRLGQRIDALDLADLVDPYGPFNRTGDHFANDLALMRNLKDIDAQGRVNQQIRRLWLATCAVTRAAGTGAFAGLTVPQYLLEDVAPIARAGMPLIDVIGVKPLPQEGMAVNFPRITAGAASSSQSSQNASVGTTDYVATDEAVGIETIAVRIDVSRPLVDRAGDAGEQLLELDALAAWANELDRQAITGTGAAGQLRGVLNQAGVQAIDYADASPTGNELLLKITYGARAASDARKRPMTAVVMHPRRWYWLCKELAATPPVVPITMFPAGSDSSPFVGTIAGLGVLLDSNVPTNVNTDQDPVVVVRPDDLRVRTEAPKLQISPQTSAATLGINVELFAPAVFTAGRYASGIAVLTGTGLADPGTW